MTPAALADTITGHFALLTSGTALKPTTLEVINAMPISEAATRKRLDRARTKDLLDGVP